MRQYVPAITESAAPELPRPNMLRSLMVLAVFLAVASSGIVFAEPAPVDVITMGLVIALPIMGMMRVTWLLVAMLAAWLVVAAAAFIASINAMDASTATIHSAISLYLYLATFAFAGFVAQAPERNAKLLLNAYLMAALIAATLGIIGYFAIVPGAEGLTRFDRATGAFKDPNVFGPFLVPAIMFLAHQIFTRPAIRTFVPLLMLSYLGLALFVSFSRGAWLNLAVAAGLYWLLAFATTASAIQRLRLIAILAFGFVAAAGALFALLQFDAIATMAGERASILQSYDVGPQGRFGGQAKAIDTILDNPLGIGALNFPGFIHHEDPHNVYLSMHLNAGWVGGFAYLAIILVTLGLGLSHALKRAPTQGLFLVAFSCLAATIVEGTIIDTDHWRHFYLLMALVWGLMAAAPAPRQQVAEPAIVMPVLRPRQPRREVRITGRFVAGLPTRRKLRQPRRPARITGRARARLPRNIAVARRSKTVTPRRPPRIEYR